MRFSRGRLGFDGPGRDRTCDLGIKSPAVTVATACCRRKRAATRTDHRYNELSRTAGPRDKPVLSFVLSFAVSSGNARPRQFSRTGPEGPSAAWLRRR
jgi:hypothetical protein